MPADTMTPDTRAQRGTGFLIGLLTGTFVGAGLALWLVPRAAAEVGDRLTDSARAVGALASDGYQQVSNRVVDIVDDLTSKGQDARNDVADALVRGAREMERFATAAKADRG